MAFEVGGLTVGLAVTVLKNPAAAPAPAIFGTFMNVIGSALASCWHDRSPLTRL